MFDAVDSTFQPGWEKIATVQGAQDTVMNKYIYKLAQPMYYQSLITKCSNK